MPGDSAWVRNFHLTKGHQVVPRMDLAAPDYTTRADFYGPG